MKKYFIVVSLTIISCHLLAMDGAGPSRPLNAAQAHEEQLCARMRHVLADKRLFARQENAQAAYEECSKTLLPAPTAPERAKGLFFELMHRKEWDEFQQWLDPDNQASAFDATADNVEVMLHRGLAKFYAEAEAFFAMDVAQRNVHTLIDHGLRVGNAHNAVAQKHGPAYFDQQLMLKMTQLQDDLMRFSNRDDADRIQNYHQKMAAIRAYKLKTVLWCACGALAVILIAGIIGVSQKNKKTQKLHS